MLLFIFYIDKILPFCSVFCKFIQEVFIIQRRNIRKYLIISAKYCIIYKACTSSSVDRATASGAVCGGSIPLWCIFFMVKRTKTSAPENYVLSQNTCVLFSRNGTKLLTCGDSSRTDVRTGLLIEHSFQGRRFLSLAAQQQKNYCLFQK